jgi:hypothetical protein
MESGQQGSRADQVRQFVIDRIVKPGRASGKRTVTVRAGDVQRELGWWNRIPSVCSALDAREFQRVSQARLIQRRGPVHSTTTEWVFAICEESGSSLAAADCEPEPVPPDRRLVALWDGMAFRPVVAPESLEPGQRVVLVVSAARDTADLAGEFGGLVGTLSAEEAVEMQGALDSAFENISDEW